MQVIMAALTRVRTGHYVLLLMFLSQHVISKFPRVIATKLSHVLRSECSLRILSEICGALVQRNCGTKT